MIYIHGLFTTYFFYRICIIIIVSVPAHNQHMALLAKDINHFNCIHACPQIKGREGEDNQDINSSLQWMDNVQNSTIVTIPPHTILTAAGKQGNKHKHFSFIM